MVLMDFEETRVATVPTERNATFVIRSVCTAGRQGEGTPRLLSFVEPVAVVAVVVSLGVPVVVALRLIARQAPR